MRHCGEHSIDARLNLFRNRAISAYLVSAAGRHNIVKDRLTTRLMRAVRLPGLSDATHTLQTALAGTLPNMAATPPVLAGLMERLGHLPGVSNFPQPNPAVTKAAPGLATPPGAAFLSGTYANAAGSRPYRLYVPSQRRRSAPLLVMLHGCTQTAEDFAAGTQMNARAEAAGALVLYPVQVASANTQRCWNWFNPADQQRDAGEPALIAGMVHQVMKEHNIDPKRVFVAGLSAGGAQAAIMASAYPDLFAGAGVHSGLACGAASDMVSAFSAMHQGRAGQGRHSVPTIIFHGDADRTVNIRNAAEVAAQLGAGKVAHTEQGNAPGGRAYTRTICRGPDGRVLVEQWTVHGAGHAWSGGDPQGSYTEPSGPDASAEMLRFFLSVAADRQLN